MYTSIERRAGFLAAVFIGLMLATGALYSLALGEQLRFLPDEQDYLTLASSLASGGGYSLEAGIPSAYRPPGYAFFLTPFRAAGMDVAMLRWLNYALFGLTVGLAFYIVRAGRAAWAGLLALAMALFYPLNFFTAGTLYPQLLTSLLLLLSLALLREANLHAGRAFLGGLCLGALTLTAPTFFVSVAVILIWLAWGRAQARAAALALALAGLVILLGAWTARNYAAMGALIFVSTNSGENLLLGNSENTTPNGGRTIDISRYEAAGAEMGEAARDRYYRDEALRYIWEHKAQSLRMYWLKTLNYFNYRNELVTSSEESGLKDLAMLLSYGPLLILAALRVAFARRIPMSSEDILWIALYLSSALAGAIFFTRIRFRQPYDFLLAMLAAPLLAHGIQKGLALFAARDNKAKMGGPAG